MTVVAAVNPPPSGLLLLAVFVGSFVVAALVITITSRKNRSTSRAHRLARHSGIELPSHLEGRIARRLRNEWLTFLFIFPLWLSPLELTSFNGHIQSATYWDTWFPRLVVLTPLFGVAVSFSGVIIARWNVPGSIRLSHLRRVRLRQAFTVAERCALAAGVGATMGVSAWGLQRSHSSIHWWAVEFGALVLAGVIWWLLENTVMDQPSTASDPVELEWDDLFRFRRVRSLAIGAAWIPPMAGWVLDSLMNQQLSHFTPSPLWVYGPLIISITVALVFRQGRLLWRTA